MRYDESTASARRVAVYLRLSGTPVTGFVPAAGQLKVSQSGDASVNGAGTWTEVGNGLYYYQATQLETTTLSYLMVSVVKAGTIDPFVWAEDIEYRIAQNELSGMRRRVPVFLQLAGIPVTGISLAAISTTSINGSVWVSPAGTFGESGNGMYWYEAAVGDVSALGTLSLRVLSGSADAYVYAQSIVSSSASSILDSVGTSGYFGGYFGAGGEATTPPAGSTTPVTIPAAVTVSSPLYVGHAEAAIARLCEYAKGK